MTNRFLSAIALTICAPIGAGANPVTISQMAQSCRAADIYCDAYIEGIQTMMQVNCQTGGRPDLSIGWFPSIEGGRSALLHWSANNPEQGNVLAFHGVVSALREAFPCS